LMRGERKSQTMAERCDENGAALLAAASPYSVPFLDLRRSLTRLGDRLRAACDCVVQSGKYILGPQTAAFEQEFARFLGVRFVVGCGSGTDAITLGLLAGGIGPGDEVITAANTAFPTVAAILKTGATPRLCDVLDDCLLMDTRSLESLITSRTRAVVPVHLYGNPAPMSDICRIARLRNLWVVEDCAQAHGALADGVMAGAAGHCGAFSFYPTKNLAAFGDGGAVATNSSEVAERLRSLRHYGQSAGYVFPDAGLCSRLDELQSAILRIKLTELETANRRRREILARYQRELRPVIRCVEMDRFGAAVAHLAVFRATRRDRFRGELARRGIETLVHYPRCVHLQPVLHQAGYRCGDFPVAEQAADEVVSLPCYPELTDEEQTTVIEAVGKVVPSI
jgi:dTDP-4-amino-4,6-dideoxygalactose transaminase